MDCPRCCTGLVEEKVSTIPLATCRSCHGTWYQSDGLSKLLRLKSTDELLDLSSNLFEKVPGELKCPFCSTTLEAKTFREHGDLTIDQCPSCHGIWFDQGELGETKRYIREYFWKSGLNRREEEESAKKTIGKLHPLRLYAVPKMEVKRYPRILPKMPSLTLEEEERDEKSEERELEAGTNAGEVTWQIWLFTAFTGLPLEVYNPPRRRPPFVVISLIVLNVLAFIAVSSMGKADVVSFFGKYGLVPCKLSSQLYTLLTHMFLHVSWVHLLGNMYFLWVFGDNIEDRLGHFGFVLFYLVCGLLAAFAQIFIAQQTGHTSVPMVGASGAIAGIMGGYLYLFPKAALYQTIVIPYPLKIPVTFYFVGWVLLQFIGYAITKSRGGGVAWWAHLGGFFAGFIIIIIWYQLRKSSKTNVNPQYPFR